jgi:hypothetical protein
LFYRGLTTCWGSSRRRLTALSCALPRLRHLELIRERAALGKDFERRDSFSAGGPHPSPGAHALLGASPLAGGRVASPLPAGAVPEAAGRESARSAAGAAARPPLSPVPSPAAAEEPGRPSQWTPAGASPRAAAPSPSPAPPGAALAARRGSPVLAAAAYCPADAALAQLLREGTQSLAPGSVTPATTPKTRLRGVRKRAAKMARRLQAAG